MRVLDPFLNIIYVKGADLIFIEGNWFRNRLIIVLRDIQLIFYNKTMKHLKQNNID
ncbi:hypothetical protein SC09_contig10orf00082 [Bacillus subtilis]|uniref:Uncharacterized protein n=1 Tax=Bacillus subtilis TaxID=1423 RepID=A0A0D1L2U4_BACIU|nr:hypothetical protein SC09_contig10orf00082 [Bacillus subtilis]